MIGCCKVHPVQCDHCEAQIFYEADGDLDGERYVECGAWSALDGSDCTDGAPHEAPRPMPHDPYRPHAGGCHY